MGDTGGDANEHGDAGSSPEPEGAVKAKLPFWENKA